MIFVMDLECFKDYFLASFKNIETGAVHHFEKYESQDLNAVDIQKIMVRHTTVSFNGLGFDLPLLMMALGGSDNKKLHAKCSNIINSKQSFAQKIPSKWNHIDLMGIAPGIASLKVYGGRLGIRKIQDLPFEPTASILPEMRETVRKYCENDLAITESLYHRLLPQIQLRESMTEQYGIDLKSKSDAQIAETVIKSELTKITGKEYGRNTKEITSLKYIEPEIIEFESPALNELFDKILDHEFTFLANGAMKVPDFMKKPIVIGGNKYQIGVGGLHSCEKSQLIYRGRGILCDYDVSSYYPRIVLQQKLFPEAMGEDFLNLYQYLVTRRLEAKGTGDKTTADTLKIVLNASFGKFGNKYSSLYSPQLLLQITMTGQLGLLMLIERMELSGIKIKSANTDGILCQCDSGKEKIMEEVVWNWELDTSFELERTDYDIVASRDVNNYFAITTSGKVKTKGCFNPGGLSKNPDRNIVYEAVINFINTRIPIEKTIKGCDDIRKFVTIRKVTGGASWCGEKIGKSVRFYSSLFPEDDCLRYTLNGNKVAGSSGCRPMMELPEWMPDDLDYGSYISDAEKLLNEVGYV